MSLKPPVAPPEGPTIVYAKRHGQKMKLQFNFHSRTITKIMTIEDYLAVKADPRYLVRGI